ncbi:5402_t:CDS:2, partial [Cetraspora pellucida]
MKYQRKFNHIYKILSLGFYPPVVKETRRNSLNGTVYQIPDNYSVSLAINKIQITCKTQYQDNGSVKFTISWINSKTKKYVTSYSSATDAGNKFLQKLGKHKSHTSGVTLFGLDLECLEKQRSQLKNSIHQQKSLNKLSSTQANRRLKLLAINIRNNIQPLLLEHSDSTTSLNLEKINLQYNHDAIELKFQSIAKDFTSSEHLDSIVYACEDSLTSRDSVRRLAAVIPEMDREHLISQRRIEINNIMNQKIPVNVFTINHAENVPNDIIRLKLGGDGRQVGRQQNHVLFTICILNEKELVLFPKNQY